MRAIIVFGLILLFGGYGYAQKYDIITYSPNNGLYDANIYDVSFSYDGFVWAASAYGIIKFDGKKSIVYGVNEGMRAELNYAVFVDSTNAVFASGEGGGLAKLVNNRFEYFTKHQALDTTIINIIKSKRQGELWLATQDHGVIIFNEQTEDIKIISKADGLADNNVWDIYFRNDREILFTSMTGVVVYDPILEEITKQFKTGEELPVESVFELTEDSNGRFWVVSDKGVVIINKDDTVEHLTRIAGHELYYTYSITMDKYHNMWIATERDGLFVVRPDGSGFQVTRKNGLGYDSLYRLKHDNKQNIWITTDGNGVNLIKDLNISFYNYTSDLSANFIYAVTNSTNGEVWLSSENGISHIVGTQINNYQLPDFLDKKNDIIDLEVLPNGSVLGINNEYILFTFDGVNFEIPPYYDVLKTEFINDIYVEDTGTVWFSAYKAIFKLQNNSIEKFEIVNDNYWRTIVESVLRDSKGNLWVITQGGVALFNNGSFNFLNQDVFNDGAYKIVENNSHQIWVSTLHNIYFADLNSMVGDSLLFYPLGDTVLINEYSEFIEFDEYDGLWQGSSSGLYYYNIADWNKGAELTKIRFSFSSDRNGLQMIDDGAIMLKDQLFFGTAGNGLMNYRFATSDGKVELDLAPEVFVRSLSTKTEKIVLNNKYNKKIVVPFSENDLTFKFDISDFKNPYDFSIRYRLNGYDEGWNEAKNLSDIKYTNIPQGEYTLEVSARTRKSEWSEIVKFPTINIEPPFYLRAWFLLLALGASLLAIRFYVKYQFSVLEQKNLKELVDRQTENLSAALDEKEVLIKEIHHRVKNNLAVVSGLLHLQGTQMPEGSAKDAIEQSKLRVQTMGKIHENLYQNEDLSNVKFNNFITELVENVENAMIQTDKEISIKQEIEDVTLSLNMGVPLGLIANEIISNAYKHAFTGREKGEIVIRFKEFEQHYVLIIQDNGIGAPDDVLTPKENSLGIVLINSLVSQVDGEIKYKNEKGSIFEMYVPKD